MGSVHVMVTIFAIIAVTTAGEDWLKRLLRDTDVCVVDGNVYRNGETFQHGDICNCECKGSQGHGCKGCPPEYCPYGEKKVEGQCCPSCREGPEEVCVVDGHIYRNGETFTHDGICNCKCKGSLGYGCMGCPAEYCPYGEEKVEGQCCPSCREFPEGAYYRRGMKDDVA